MLRRALLSPPRGRRRLPRRTRHGGEPSPPARRSRRNSGSVAPAPSQATPSAMITEQHPAARPSISARNCCPLVTARSARAISSLTARAVGSVTSKPAANTSRHVAASASDPDRHHADSRHVRECVGPARHGEHGAEPRRDVAALCERGQRRGRGPRRDLDHRGELALPEPCFEAVSLRGADVVDGHAHRAIDVPPRSHREEGTPPERDRIGLRVR